MQYDDVEVIMTSILVTAIACALSAQAGAARPEPPPELALLEATVLRGEEAVAQPTMVIKVGEDGELTVGHDRAGPVIRMRFRVDALSPDARRASVTSFVDGQKVGANVIDYTIDTEAAGQWAGGGLSWTLRVARMTPELMQRRKQGAPAQK